MGLLDDAIREHLESKRLHGADPEEVARQEHEALGPVYRGEGPAPTEPAAPPQSTARPSERLSAGDKGPNPEAVLEMPHSGQETAELDMRTVLKAEQPAPTELAAKDPAPASAGSSIATTPNQHSPATHSSQETPAEDSLEWEVPRSHLSDNAHDADGGHPAEMAASDAGEQVEDVLEETPDFLRETPDQERLWFEQQPPRDFDFDK
jgi:hypothetical protein